MRCSCDDTCSFYARTVRTTGFEHKHHLHPTRHHPMSGWQNIDGGNCSYLLSALYTYTCCFYCIMRVCVVLLCVPLLTGAFQTTPRFVKHSPRATLRATVAPNDVTTADTRVLLDSIEHPLHKHTSGVTCLVLDHPKLPFMHSFTEFEIQCHWDYEDVPLSCRNPTSKPPCMSIPTSFQNGLISRIWKRRSMMTF